MRALLLLAVIASPALAQSGGGSVRQSADAFTLDLPPADGEATPDGTASEPVPAAEKTVARFSADTPIDKLIANRRAKAVLDREMPGLSSDKNLPKFSKLSLRQLAPLSGGRVTPELLARVDADLAGIN